MPFIYRGVGEFGNILADKVNADGRTLNTISNDLKIDPKTIRSHINRTHKPYFIMLSVYSNYLDRPIEELAEMVDRDWDVSTPKREFAKTIREIMYRHGLTVDELSFKTGISTKTLYKWLKGTEPRPSNYIRFMKVICEMEGLI